MEPEAKYFYDKYQTAAAELSALREENRQLRDLIKVPSPIDQPVWKVEELVIWFTEFAANVAWFDNDTKLWNTLDEGLDPFRYSNEELYKEFIDCGMDTEKFLEKHQTID